MPDGGIFLVSGGGCPAHAVATIGGWGVDIIEP